MSADAPAAALAEKLKQVQRILGEFDRVVIAFSGGVDSTLLATLSRDVLGNKHVLAVTADSPSLSRADLQDASRLAGQLGLPHLVIPTAEVEEPSYRMNTPARCYVCKQALFQELEALARARQIPVVLYGAIGDDRLAERPGQRAAMERGVRAPLQEAGLTKWEVRELAKALGLPNWNRPQNACLASRVPHGQEVTKEKLRQIEQAETFLHAKGFRQVRVRHLGTHACIEVGQDEVARFQDHAMCRTVATYFEEALGFETTSVDRSGYHPGGAQRREVDEVLLHAGTTC